MSPARTPTTQPNAALNLPPLSQVVMALALLVAAWELRHRTRKGLAYLEPHLLRDIGLDGLTVDAECAKPFWKA